MVSAAVPVFGIEVPNRPVADGPRALPVAKVGGYHRGGFRATAETPDTQQAGFGVGVRELDDFGITDHLQLRRGVRLVRF